MIEIRSILRLYTSRGTKLYNIGTVDVLACGEKRQFHKLYYIVAYRMHCVYRARFPITTTDSKSDGTFYCRKLNVYINMDGYDCTAEVRVTFGPGTRYRIFFGEKQTNHLPLEWREFVYPPTPLYPPSLTHYTTHLLKTFDVCTRFRAVYILL